MGKLAGLTVVDLGLFLPGPALTGMMADQGARVIKVEPPGGDPARHMAPHESGHSFWFRQWNRGKEALTLDLKTPEGKAALHALVVTADVFVEGFRPGVIARLGFDYPALAPLNPGLVYCSISAFGQHGPLAHHPAHDLGVQALIGFLSVNDGPPAANRGAQRAGTPVVPGVPAADMAASLTALSAILMALHARHTTGRGDYIDIAMADALLPWSAHIAGDAAIHGTPVRSVTQRSLGGAAFYQVYETADHRHIVLCGREEKFVANLLTAIGRADLVPAALAPAGPQQAPVIAHLTAHFQTRTRDEWVEWFHSRDIAFAPVLDFAEAFAHPHVYARSLLVEAGGARHLAPAIRFATGPDWHPAQPPAQMPLPPSMAPDHGQTTSGGKFVA